MKKINLLCTVLLMIMIMPAFAVPVSAEIDESREPSESYRLLMSGQEIPLFTDKDTELPENAGKAKARLIVEPNKRFTYGGIELSYPRYFTFEADLSEPGVRLWSLSGNQAVLMVQRYPVVMDHRTMAEQLLPSFGAGNSKLSECEITLEQKKTAGSRVITTIGEGIISQEIYSFAMASGSLLLIIQDTIVADGSSSAETSKFHQQLAETFKIIK